MREDKDKQQFKATIRGIVQAWHNKKRRRDKIYKKDSSRPDKSNIRATIYKKYYTSTKYIQSSLRIYEIRLALK